MRERALRAEDAAYEALLARVEAPAPDSISPALRAAWSANSEGGAPDGVLLRALAVTCASHAFESFRPAPGHEFLVHFLARERKAGAVERHLLRGPVKMKTSDAGKAEEAKQGPGPDTTTASSSGAAKNASGGDVM